MDEISPLRRLDRNDHKIDHTEIVIRDGVRIVIEVCSCGIKDERELCDLKCIHCGKTLSRGTFCGKEFLIDETGGDVCGWAGGNEPHELKEMCAFCDGQNEATHWNTDWDANLCDECADAQDRALAEAMKEKIEDIFPGLGDWS